MTLATFRNHLVARIAGTLSRWRGPRVPGAFGILMYHQTSPLVTGQETVAWNVVPERFAEQIEGLLAAGYEAWPLRKALVHAGCGRPVPRNAFVVTFDDGYESVYRWAWPILKRLDVPATVFLATAYLDSQVPFPFDTWALDRWRSLPAEGYRPLSSKQCAEMLEEGHVELGSHTHTHADFRGRPDALRRDLAASLDFLRARFGLKDATFSFPFGFYDPSLASAARQAGALCSLTTRSELILPRSDPLDWGRFAVAQHDTAAILAGKLDGWYNFARDAWLPIRRAAQEAFRRLKGRCVWSHTRRAAQEAPRRLPVRSVETDADVRPTSASQKVLSP
jgi:peptidoglycan/xylan/chitin deacetylase (PgdA/CDA1 family)